jgi:hypothetical protein
MSYLEFSLNDTATREVIVDLERPAAKANNTMVNAGQVNMQIRYVEKIQRPKEYSVVN